MKYMALTWVFDVIDLKSENRKVGGSTPPLATVAAPMRRNVRHEVLRATPRDTPTLAIDSSGCLGSNLSQHTRERCPRQSCHHTLRLE